MLDPFLALLFRLKRFVVIFVLLCGLVFCGSQAKAQLTADGKVDVVQAHFHFKDPITGNDIDHNALKTVLLHNNGNGTYLDQGILICSLMDTRDQFAARNYEGVTAIVTDKVIKALGYPTGIGVLVDTIEYAIDFVYPGVGIIFEVYKDFSQLEDSWELITNIVASFQASLINGLIQDYINTVSDPYHDDAEWADLEIRYGALIKNTSFDLHAYSRIDYLINKRINTTLPTQIDQYTRDINALVKGAVHLDYSPAYYALYAPVAVTISGAGSTGTFGSAITNYQWTLDGKAAGNGSAVTNIQQTFWQPGTHTVSLTVTDPNGSQTGNNTFFVGSPPITATIDKANFAVSFSTPSNSLVTDYKWDFGDGRATQHDVSLTSVTHSYPNGVFQTYTAQLTETPQQGNPITVPQTIQFQQIATDVYAGTLSDSQTWGTFGSPYRIHGNVVIPKGVRLTLNPGVVLQFDANTSLDIYGELVSRGQFSSDQLVYFTSHNDGSVPGLAGSDTGQPGDWNGLHFEAGSSATLVGSKIRYASTGVSGDVPTIAGTTLDRCGNGISLDPTRTTATTISGNTIVNCNNGVNDSASSNLTVTGNTLIQSPSDFSGSARDLTFTGNTITGGGISFYGTFGLLALSSNSSTDAGGMSFNLNGVTLTKNNTWALETGIKLIDLSSYLTVASGATLTLAAGMILQMPSDYNSSYYYLTILGDLRSTGTAANPAIITVVGDDTPYGGSNNNAQWSGLQYGAGTTANLSGISVRNAYTGIQGVPSIVTGGYFSNCYRGVYLDSTRTTPAAITGNTVINCQNGINDDSGVSLIVTGNTLIQSPSGFSGSGRDLTFTGNTVTGGSVSFYGTFGLLALSSNSSPDTGGVQFYLNNVALTKNNTWALETGIKLINPASQLTIAAGATLTLAAGMVLQMPANFNSNVYYMNILGDLRSTGTAANPAIITVAGDETPYGGDYNNALCGGVLYAAGTTANLSGLSVRNAYTGIQGAPSTVSGGYFSNCYRGIYLDSIRTTPATISGNTVVNCQNGINDDSSASLIVTGNTLIRSPSGFSGSARDLTFTGNAVTGGGVSFYGTFGLLALSSNSSTDAVRVPFYLYSLTLTKNNTWALETGIKLIDPASHLTVAAGATLTLAAGMILQMPANFNSSVYYMNILGDLRSTGTAANPAIITVAGDETPYGGAYNNALCGGVLYAVGTTANLGGLTIQHANVGLSADTANLTDCNFYQNNIGVSSNAGGGTYRGCSFVQNNTAVSNGSVNDIDARYNWWGDATGPYNATNNPGGLGNPVSNHVIVGSSLGNSSILASLTLAPTTVTVGQTSTATVTLSGPAPAGNALVTLSAGGSAAVTIPASAIITAGQNQATFPVTSVGTAAATVTISATYAGITQTATLSITAAVADAPPTVATAAHATPNPVTGATATLAVLGADDGGEAALTYTWAVTAMPSGAVAPTFSVNGTNASKNTVVTFKKAGAYTFTVTIKEPSGLTVTSSVGVTVNQTISFISVTPSTVSLAPGATQQFTASAKDLFGATMTTQPAFTWTATGGSVTSAGLYTAGAANGAYQVTAAALGKTAKAAVTVAGGALVLTTIAVSPVSATITAGTTQQFTATGKDQNGNPMSPQPAFMWSVSGGGTISSSGLFTAGSTAGGPFTVTATAGGKSGTASVTVSPAGSDTPPTVATPAAATPNPVTSTTTALSVLGADDGGAAALTYTWAATTVPSGAAAPTFSANGTNSAKNTTATFKKAGSYTFTVTVKEPSALSCTSSVSVTVNQTISFISVTPTPVTVTHGATQQFTATAKDLFGNAMSVQPAMTWTATGGMVNSAGLYTAGSTTGAFAVTAAAGGKSGKATVTIN